MIVLADQDNVVYSRGKHAAAALKRLQAARPWLTLRLEWLPDDTVFERRPAGGFVLAADQPDGWNARRQQGATTRTQARQAIALLEANDIPDTITMDQAVTYFRQIRRILLGILRNVVNG